MEGNECYKFSTIDNYVALSRAQPIRTVLEIGVHVGIVTDLIRRCFPDAKIYGFEAVKEYYDQARSAVKGKRGIKLFNKAVTSQHLFVDDLGARRRPKRVPLRILKGTPVAGPGWAGGSRVVPADDVALAGSTPPGGFALIDQPVRPVTLDEAVDAILKAEEVKTIDIVKLDCEGCEHSTLGCATPATLARLRFIVGEYHDIERFYQVMEGRLFHTHKVNLIGDRALGCFFAERLDGTADGVLRYDKTGMRQPRPWLSATPIEWHLFDERYVLTHERAVHALPGA